MHKTHSGHDISSAETDLIQGKARPNWALCERRALRTFDTSLLDLAELRARPFFLTSPQTFYFTGKSKHQAAVRSHRQNAISEADDRRKMTPRIPAAAMTDGRRSLRSKHPTTARFSRAVRFCGPARPRYPVYHCYWPSAHQSKQARYYRTASARGPIRIHQSFRGWSIKTRGT